jgi:S1-C subfamily serine protease
MRVTKSMKPRRLVATSLVFASVALAACGIVRGVAPAQQPTTAPTPAVIAATPAPLPPQVVQAAGADEQVVIDIYARVSPAVVHITSRIVVRDFFYGDVPQEGTGSGFVLDLQGHIVTNNHVVENAEKITVTLSDETSLEARVVGTDPSTDLAVVQIDTSPDRLHPVELGASANLRVGQRAIAIGNPFGLDRTLTTGVISSLGRPLQTQNNGTIYDVIQTDAAINPGNSGGPLLDSSGRVIGVNSAIYSPSGGSVGVGFAIPVDTVRRVTASIIEKGYYPHPWLGVTGLSITSDLANYLKLPVERGVLVINVTAGQAAAQAGVRGGSRRVQIGNYVVPVGGDILTAIDANKVAAMEDMVKYLETKTKVGQAVSLTIMRDGKEQTVQATLGEQPRS